MVHVTQGLKMADVYVILGTTRLEQEKRHLEEELRLDHFSVIFP